MAVLELRGHPADLLTGRLRQGREGVPGLVRLAAREAGPPERRVPHAIGQVVPVEGPTPIALGKMYSPLSFITALPAKSPARPARNLSFYF